MNRIKLLFYVCLCCLGIAACSEDPDSNGLSHNDSTVKLEFKLPNSLQVSPTTVSLSFTDKNSGKKTVFENLGLKAKDHTLQLTKGLYDVVATAKVTENGVEHNFTSSVNNWTLGDKEAELSILLLPVVKSNGFLIKEIFFSSSPDKETGEPYVGGQYVIITNNSDKTLYADSLVFAAAAANTSYDTKEIYSKYLPKIATQFMFMIPGNGKEHPVKPGEDLVLTLMAKNYTENSTLLPNLNNANFEWKDDTSFPGFLEDNPNVPNMEVLYSETGFGSFLTDVASVFIFKLPMPLEDFKKKYDIETPYANPDLPPAMISYIPDDMVIDGVQIAEGPKINQKAFPSSVDKSHTYVDAPGKGFTVQRKVLYVLDHRTVYQDENDSMNDFERNLHSSLLKK